MRIWLDNTGLHSAGRALAGRAESDWDVKGLLQLVTQLIFAEELRLNSFEADEVFQRSLEVRGQLIADGLDPKVLCMEAVDESVYRGCCLQSADRLADEIDLTSLVHGVPPAATEPELSARTSQFAARARKLIQSRPSQAELAERAQLALSRKAAGAVEFMLTGSKRLWSLVSRKPDSGPSPRPEQIGHLSVALRYYLNEELARYHDAIYGPAVMRATLITKMGSDLLATLNAVVTDAAMKVRARALLEPRELGVPSLAEALVKQADGDVETLIRLAIEARAAAEPLRNWLGGILTEFAPDTGNGVAEVDECLRDLMNTLHKELGIVDTANIKDKGGLEFQVNVWGVSFGCSGGTTTSALERIRHRWKRRRVAVLVKLSRILAFTGAEDPSLMRLYRRCHSNA